MSTELPQDSYKVAETGSLLVSDVESPLSYDSPSATDAESRPSYESSFEMMKLAKETSNGKVNFTKNCFNLHFCSILLRSLVYTISLGILLVTPISMIVIGAVYLRDCPAQMMIPIYLIGQGSIALVYGLILLIKNVTKKSEKYPKKSKAQLGVEDKILMTIIFVWFIPGNALVYRSYDSWQRYDSTLNTYCNPTLYYFSFWAITSFYITVGVCIIIWLLFRCFHNS